MGLIRLSLHVCLKNRVSDFRNVRPFYFYKQIYSGMRNYCHHQWKVGYNFEMKRRIEIRRHGFVGNPSDNNLAKFQPNWFRDCWLGFQNACTTRPNFHIEKQGLNRFSTAMRLPAPRRQANKVLIGKRKYQFSWTTVVWQEIRNRQIFVVVGNFLAERKPLPRPTQQFIPWG